MAKRPTPQDTSLKSWKEIAEYLHKPVSTVQRWAREGMPVERRGRYVVASAKGVSEWLGEEMHAPLHVAEPGEDLAAELRAALTSARGHRGRKV